MSWNLVYFTPLIVEPSLINFLYNHCVCIHAGATLLSNLKGNLSLPRQMAANTATWASEAGAISRTAGSYDAVELAPNRCGIVTAYSKQLIAQSSLDVENIIREDMLRVIGVAIDTGALNGSGAGNNQPTGIMQLSANLTTADPSWDVTKRAPNQTFGGPATFNSVAALEGAVENCNVELDKSAAYIVSPLTKARWKTIPLAVNWPKFLWGRADGSDLSPLPSSPAIGGVPGNVNGHKAFATKTINAPVAGNVLFGKFSDMLIGQWGGVDMVTDPYSLGDSYQIRVIIHILLGVAFRHAVSFVASTDSGAQ